MNREIAARARIVTDLGVVVSAWCARSCGIFSSVTLNAHRVHGTISTKLTCRELQYIQILHVSRGTQIRFVRRPAPEQDSLPFRYPDDFPSVRPPVSFRVLPSFRKPCFCQDCVWLTAHSAGIGDFEYCAVFESCSDESMF